MSGACFLNDGNGQLNKMRQAEFRRMSESGLLSNDLDDLIFAVIKGLPNFPEVKGLTYDVQAAVVEGLSECEVEINKM